MKKIKKIGALISILMLNFYNQCFADVIWMDPETGEWVGGSAPRPTQTNYFLIGIIVLIVVVCAVFIIRRIIKNKKEKENDINK